MLVSSPPVRDPADLTPDERLAELAALLADAILALRDRAALPARTPTNSCGNDLANRSESSVTVPAD